MIIPSIDIMKGHAVQLVGGEKFELDAGNPLPLAEKFRIAGEIAVIDLDAALNQGNNRKVIEKLCRVAKCRVGGGIRDLETAQHWLNAGAEKIIIGTKASPEFLKQLPKERLMAALDARHGEVVTEGWTKKTGVRIEDRIKELSPYVSGFLITFVEREGRLQGTDLDYVKKLRALTDLRLTIAGGVTTVKEIADLDALGADAQVGMALYKNQMDLGEAIGAPLRVNAKNSEKSLWPTVVVDEMGMALGLVWSDQESICAAVKEKKGIYHSRTRGLWVKGETSGATQELLEITLDCDRDALCFRVRQKEPGFCHLQTRTCFGADRGLTKLFRLLQNRKKSAPKKSYTKRLFAEKNLLHSKIVEEAKELTRAKSKKEVILEASDVLYFTLVKMAKSGVTLQDVSEELDFRGLKISRRGGEAKK